MLAGGLLALVHGVFCIHLRADQIVVGTAIIFLAYGITGFLYNDIYGDQGTPGDLPRIPDVNLDWLGSIPPAGLGRFLEESFGELSVLTLLALALVFVSYVVLFKTPLGLRIRSCGEHPRAADTVGINVYGIRYGSVVVSGVLAALGGVYLSIGYNGSFTEKMTAGPRLHRTRSAHLRNDGGRLGRLRRACCSASRKRLRSALREPIV